MSDFDLDALLAGAVDDYNQQTLPQIRPVGSGQARATATHRKRVHTAMMGAIALVVVAVPAGVYAATEHNHNGPPPVGSSQSPSPQPSGSPSASPSPTPSTVSSPPTLAAITQQELSNATLSMPPWSAGACPSGTVKLHNGQFGGAAGAATNARSMLTKSVSVDLDGDGSADTVALFQCELGNPGISQAVGFRRAPDGSIQTLGKVATDIDTIADARAGDASTVQLQVSNLAGSDGVAETGQVKQWRTYEWDGTRFNQTAGSTSFSVAIPKLTVTLSDLTFQAPVNGKRTGTMTVTLHNGGTSTIDNASVVYELPYTETAPKCDQVAADLLNTGQCPVQPLAPGAMATVTFTLSAGASEFTGTGTFPLGGGPEILIQIRVGDQALATQPPLGKLIIK